MGEDLRALMAGERRGWKAAGQRIGLRCASLPYGFAVALRNRLFDGGLKSIVRVAAPVISVGNLTVGGTGKTPCVEYIAERLREWGRNVAILSRGYGSQSGPNDEALVLAQNLAGVPHLQGPDRVDLARKAVEKLRCDTLVLDDGFQHRRLARDLDIVLLDSTSPWGYGHFLPRGLLRESPRSLRRAGVILLTRCDQVCDVDLDRLREEVGQLAPQTPIVESVHEPASWIDSEGRTKPLDNCAGQAIAAFCGIGNPQAFRQTLLNLGLSIKAFLSFPDHHAYSQKDIVNLNEWAKQEASGSVVVTTQKDLVKLRLTRLGESELFALRIQLRILAGHDALDLKLKEALG